MFHLVNLQTVVLTSDAFFGCMRHSRCDHATSQLTLCRVRTASGVCFFFFLMVYFQSSAKGLFFHQASLTFPLPQEAQLIKSVFTLRSVQEGLKMLVAFWLVKKKQKNTMDNKWRKTCFWFHKRNCQRIIAPFLVKWSIIPRMTKEVLVPHSHYDIAFWRLFTLQSSSQIILGP